MLLKVRTEFQRCHSDVLKEWTDWARDCAPANDSVEDYVKKKGLHIPLGSILFSDAPVDPTIIPPDNTRFVLKFCGCATLIASDIVLLIYLVAN